jgi:hypothetical protein
MTDQQKPARRLHRILRRIGTAAGAATVTGALVTGALVQAGPAAASVAGDAHGSGYVWAYASAATIGQPYSVSGNYQYNTTGAADSITHTGTGTYTVDFPGLAPWGTALTTAYGSGSAHCKLYGWNGDGSGGTTVSIGCYDHTGNLVDSQFTASYTYPGYTGTIGAYVWADHPASTSYTPNTTYQFNDSGALNTIARIGTGIYQVTLPNVRSGLGGGDAQVTSYGGWSSYSDQCQAGGWYDNGAAQVVTVRCFSVTGAPADSYFAMTFGINTTMLLAGTGHSSAYAWADQPTAPNYTPNTWYSYNSAGGTTAVNRGGTGQYTVLFPVDLSSGDVEVTAYGGSPVSCKTAYWNSDGVRVNCFDAAGAPADSYFDVSFTS